jgi:uncharacterized protein YpuA (DUF1002 family)
MIKDKIIARLIQDTADKLDLTEQQVEDIHNSVGLFIRRTISNIDFSEIETEEDFNKVKTNFTIPYIGKLYTNFKALNYKRIQSKKRLERNSDG